MPDKSRRSRRNISSKRKTDNVLKETGSLVAGNSINSATTVSGGNSSTNSQKLTDTGCSSTAYLWAEIKWIGIVTLIIIILMVISYLIFK
jgi:hypothetical protein